MSYTEVKGCLDISHVNEVSPYLRHQTLAFRSMFFRVMINGNKYFR